MSTRGSGTSQFSVNPVVLYRDLRDAFAMFWAVMRRKYPLPWRSVLWFLLFALYFIVPFDAVPEAVFLILGFSDDLLLLVYVLNKMRPDIDNYRAWRARSQTAPRKKGGKDEKIV
ncbi:MAG: DUF1232 domain-containing protein [Elusimicrobiota bacterium]|jgi:uncharacterized membrane protein YkvA (DUF1232 family)|nr:DUF1232 domain-containing protein [Elusimicrobiota bacterium]